MGSLSWHLNEYVWEIRARPLRAGRSSDTRPRLAMFTVRNDSRVGGGRVTPRSWSLKEGGVTSYVTWIERLPNRDRIKGECWCRLCH
jgi:hypothetical protein